MSRGCDGRRNETRTPRAPTRDTAAAPPREIAFFAIKIKLKSSTSALTKKLIEDAGVVLVCVPRNCRTRVVDVQLLETQARASAGSADSRSLPPCPLSGTA
ncbi:hypothetical protein EVAR_76961_1 [Eumeta japonica]|uniref:Uncharacterized protein n=1 Tax=Eumeta variegata TaxID=151549 RepID=A0A4C1SFB6_EUMVA|nr:hypothetical protein EVAR_76961_1 [Eumeta japonica]